MKAAAAMHGCIPPSPSGFASGANACHQHPSSELQADRDSTPRCARDVDSAALAHFLSGVTSDGSNSLHPDAMLLGRRQSQRQTIEPQWLPAT